MHCIARILNMQNQHILKLIEEIKEITSHCLNKGWAERNAGNFSYRLDDNIVDVGNVFMHSVLSQEETKPHHHDPTHAAFEGGCDISFLISNSGAKFRDIAKDPLKHCSIVCSKEGNLSYYSTDKKAIPSSELQSHLLIQRYLQKEQPVKKSVIHTHPTHLIAFTHKFVGTHPHCPKKHLNDILESIMPEVSMFIPQKTGFVDLLPAGSSELAEATLKELTHHDVIVWKKHGCLAVAETLWDAIDMIEILDKAAYIALLSDLN